MVADRCRYISETSVGTSNLVSTSAALTQSDGLRVERGCFLVSVRPEMDPRDAVQGHHYVEFQFQLACLVARLFRMAQSVRIGTHLGFGQRDPTKRDRDVARRAGTPIEVQCVLQVAQR